MGFNTELLHGTKTGDPVTGATLTPVYQSSAFFQPSAEQHEKLFHNKAAGYSYTRINNPTIAAFEERMTVLEKGVASVACASGMAAITSFSLEIPSTLTTRDALSKEEFDTIMQTGLAQAKADDSLAMDDAFNQLKAEI